MSQRHLLAGVIGCIAVAGVFVGSLAWVNSATHCSPGSVCDVPVYAGIGVGLLLAPIVWFISTWVTFVLTRPPGQPSWMTVLPPRPSGQRSRWRNPLGSPEGSLLLKLAMLATLPVLLIVATAGFLGARHGSSTLWGALAVGSLHRSFSPWELPLICGSLFNSCLGWPPNTRPKLTAPRV